FEKPEADACARVRPGADLTGNLRQIFAVIEACPTDAIRLERTPAGLG
ncbi:MAG: hypothetical protein HY721_11040, partial [Planctomycetes bacterium]|nr:hypothetical protein [Planctomycetota bacterium]